MSIDMWQEQSVAPSGIYEDKIFTCYIDGEYISFDLADELAAAEEWNWSAAGVFRREGEDKTYICLQDYNITYEEGVVQEPQLMLLEFDTDNPEDYEVFPFSVAPPNTFGWDVICYRLENEIYISFRNELAAIDLTTKQLRYCQDEYDILEAYAQDKLSGEENIHNFQAVLTQNDIIVYGAQASDGFTGPVTARVFVVVKDNQPVAYMHVELTDSGEVYSYDIEMK